MNNIDLSTTKTRKRPEFFSEQVREARWFYLDLAPPADVPLAVVCGGCEMCQADYAVHRTTFAYTAIEFVADGRGSLVLGGQAHELLPGTVFSYAGDVAHHITTDPKQPLVKYFVNFTGSRGAELLQTCRLAPGSHGRVFAPAEIQAVFDRLIQDGVKGTRFSSTLCAALAVSKADACALVHELQVHKIELEMQNEELQRAQAAAQEASERYYDLFDFAPVAYFLWDQHGRILEVNLAGAALLGLDRDAVIHQRFGQFMAMQDRGALPVPLVGSSGGRSLQTKTPPVSRQRARDVRVQAAESASASTSPCP